MMTNLFSSFDPTTSFSMQLNWISSILGFLFIPLMFWLIPSRYSMIWTKLFSLINKEFSILLPTSMKMSTIVFITLFTFIMFNNVLGLFPYIFTGTSHLAFSLSLALPLWLSFMIFGWMKNSTSMLAHLMPQGTPPILMPFMVCIETISNMIRPGTLAIRLTANMIAGHMLLTLLGNTGSLISYTMLNILMFTQILLLILESAVAMIQSYVFAILSTLYSSEVT
uniref:ATP synthase subunit a n=1 Tax=Byrrhus sp. MJTNT-2012 TaxID=1131599 RepID=H6W8L3_9COLE|nr:ATP synthase F0 subunit 6 [Byrrhus sp. MJTNT-2012]